MGSAHILDEKKKLVEDLDLIFGCGGVYMFDYRGLKVSEFEGLRRKVKGAEGNVKVLKNRLAVKYFEKANIDVGRSVFSGPVAVAYSEKKMVEVAKILVDFEKESKKIKIRSGLIERRLVTDKQIQEVAKLPPREQLLVHMVMAISSPLRKFGLALQSPLSNVLVLLKNLKDKKEKGGE
jgi:large subunit ribosomal protein L10